MAIKTLKPANPAPGATTPDPAMAFIEGQKAPKPSEPEEDAGKKDIKLQIYFDAPLVDRLDRERKRRGGMSRSAYLRQLAAEHLPE